MPRIKKPAKVKEPIRLRMKELADGSKSLYLDIYRNGKRSYEYLKMYIIPETDDNARKRNAATMTAANTIKSRRIIELTNGEAGIKRADNQETVSLLDWMNTYMENQQKRGKASIGSGPGGVVEEAVGLRHWGPPQRRKPGQVGPRQWHQVGSPHQSSIA